MEPYVRIPITTLLWDPFLGDIHQFITTPCPHVICRGFPINKDFYYSLKILKSLLQGTRVFRSFPDFAESNNFVSESRRFLKIFIRKVLLHIRDSPRSTPPVSGVICIVK
jgi:hypothetical protein